MVDTESVSDLEGVLVGGAVTVLDVVVERDCVSDLVAVGGGVMDREPVTDCVRVEVPVAVGGGVRVRELEIELLNV